MKRHNRQSPFTLFAFQDIVTGLCGIVILLVLVMILDIIMKRDSGSTPHDQEISLVDKTSELQEEIATLKAELTVLKTQAEGVIVSTKDKAAPEISEKLGRELSEKEKKNAALFSQVEALRTRVADLKAEKEESRKKIREMEETRRLLERKLAGLKDKKGVTLIPERGENKIPVYLVLGRGGVEVLKPLEKTTCRKWFYFSEIGDGLRNEFANLDHTTHTVVLLVRPSGVTKMNDIADMVRAYGITCGRDPLEEDVDVSLVKTEGDDS